MEITDFREGFDNRPKLLIGIHLLKVGLGQPAWVTEIRWIWSVDDLHIAAPHLLLGHLWSPLVILRKLQTITPMASLSVKVHFNVDCDVRVPSRVKRANLRDTAARADCGLKTAALRVGDVPEEAERVQKVRLARRVGTD